MAAPAKRAIDRSFSGLRPKALQYLSHHDGDVTTGGSLPGGADLFDVIRVALGVVFLVFLVECSRVPPWIPWPS
jgi:hypothetical protein